MYRRPAEAVSIPISSPGNVPFDLSLAEAELPADAPFETAEFRRVSVKPILAAAQFQRRLLHGQEPIAIAVPVTIRLNWSRERPPQTSIDKAQSATASGTCPVGTDSPASSRRLTVRSTSTTLLLTAYPLVKPQCLR